MIQNEKKEAKLLRLISWYNRYCLFAKGNPRSRTCKLLTGSLELSFFKKRQKKVPAKTLIWTMGTYEDSKCELSA